MPGKYFPINCSYAHTYMYIIKLPIQDYKHIKKGENCASTLSSHFASTDKDPEIQRKKKLPLQMRCSLHWGGHRRGMPSEKGWLYLFPIVSGMSVHVFKNHLLCTC